MKIGIFTDTYLPDINGVSTSILTVETELRKLGHDVLIFAPDDKLKYESFPDQHVWRFPSMRYYGEKRFRFALPYYPTGKLRKFGIEIVHTQTPFSIGFIGLRFARRYKLRKIHTYHTRYPEYAHYLKLPSLILKPVGKIIMGAIIRFLNRHDAIIAPSHGIKRELESFGVRKPISVIPTGIDIEKIVSLGNASGPEEIIKKYNLSSDNELVVFTSRLAQEKNIEFLLAAMKIVIDQRPQVRFLIIGDGDHKKSLEETAEKMGLKDKTIFTGFMKHDQIFPIYKAAKVFVFASTTETQGLVGLEAMATGLPVVALKATGTEDLFVNDSGGFMIDGNADVFANAVLRLLSDSELHKTKSMEAIKRAEDFSIEKTIQSLIGVYKG